MLGLHCLEQLLYQLAYRHDWKSWQQLMGLLVPAIYSLLDRVLDATHRLQVRVRV